jgi:hypothetical protein
MNGFSPGINGGEGTVIVQYTNHQPSDEAFQLQSRISCNREDEHKPLPSQIKNPVRTSRILVYIETPVMGSATAPRTRGCYVIDITLKQLFYCTDIINK